MIDEQERQPTCTGGETTAEPAGATGNEPGADTLSAAQVEELKKRFGLDSSTIAVLGPAQGLTPAQVAAIVAGRDVILEPGQRALLNRAVQGAPGVTPGEGQSAAERGIVYEQFVLPRGVERQEAVDGAWACTNNKPGGSTSALQAPTGQELTQNPVVRAAMEQSWVDSQPGDASNRHEEGGWIYMDTSTGAITTRRAARGAQASINLWNPPTVSGSVVIGN